MALKTAVRFFFLSLFHIIWGAGILPPAFGSDAGDRMAQQLFAAGTNPPMSVAAGNFLYQDTDQLSAFSSLLHDQTEKALARTAGVRLVSYNRLVELQFENMRSGSETRGAFPLDPGQTIKPMRIQGVQALVRGRYFVQPTNVVIHAELVMLETAGIISKAEVSMSGEEVSALRRLAAPEAMPINFAAGGKLPLMTPGMMPDMAPFNFAAGGKLPLLPLGMMPDMAPYNFWTGESNIFDVAYRLSSVPHDFGIEVVVEECKRRFAGGESINYRIRPQMACHVAVFDHEVDGSTVLLFPNSYQTNTLMPGGAYSEVPGYNRDYFCLRIGRPFGADVIQIIACTEKSALHMKMEQAAQTVPRSVVLAGVPRRALAEELRGIRFDAGAKVKWAETRLVLCTYPKAAQ